MGNKKRRHRSAQDQTIRFQPIEFLPQLAEWIDDYVSDADGLWEDLEQARGRPFVLDEDTVKRIQASHTEGLEIFETFEKQLERWTALELADARRAEVERLQGQVAAYRGTAARLLDLAAELRKTSESELDDAEVGLRFLAGELPLPLAPGEKRRGSSPPPFTMPPEVESRPCHDLSTGEFFYEFHHRRLGRLGRIIVAEGPQGNSILRGELSHEPRQNLEERKAYFSPLATALMEHVARLQRAGWRAPG